MEEEEEEAEIHAFFWLCLALRDQNDVGYRARMSEVECDLQMGSSP